MSGLRGRKCSDSLPPETWQAARQNFGTSPANKLHAAFRQLTPWFLNPSYTLYFPFFVLYVWSAYLPTYLVIPNPSQVYSLQRISYSLNPLSQVVINESLSIIYLVFFSPLSD